jgi:hypothetical protein
MIYGGRTPIYLRVPEAFFLLHSFTPSPIHLRRQPDFKARSLHLGSREGACRNVAEIRTRFTPGVGSVHDLRPECQPEKSVRGAESLMQQKEILEAERAKGKA